MTKEEVNNHFENRDARWWTWTLDENGVMDGIKQLMKDGSYEYIKYKK